MKNINLVQVILLVVSGFAIVIAVFLFATYRGGSGDSRGGSVVMWGTISEEIFTKNVSDLQLEDKVLKNLIYVQKNPLTYDNDLLRALAEGSGPDLILLNEKQIYTNQNRLQTIPHEVFPLRTYQEMFLDEGNLLLTQNGIVGFPFLVDPLVMYYNKDILSNNGFSKPPENWTEVLAITPTITQKDSSFNITKSSIALGSYDNINNAKDIYWALTMQAGNPIIERNLDSQDQIEKLVPILDQNLNYTLSPAYASTNFYTQFSNPTKTVYSWNRSLPNSQTAFVSGDLAFYLGFASELPLIRQINPNLNFDVTMLPQSQTSERKITYGAMMILTVPKASKNPVGAMNMIYSLTSKPVQKSFSLVLGIPSVRRDLLSTYDASNSFDSVFNRSAIISRGVLEPSPTSSNTIVKELIDTVVSGQFEISTAIDRAQQKLIASFNE